MAGGARITDDGRTTPPDEARADGGDVLTVLRDTGGKVMAKVHTYTGKQGEAAIATKAAPKGYKFTVEAWPVDGVASIANALADLVGDTSRAVIPGALIEGRDPDAPIRRIMKPKLDSKTGEVYPANFEGRARRWLAVDIDKLPNPEGHNPADDPDGAAEYLLEHIPPEMSAASFALQWTASQNLDVARYGHTPKTLHARLWFWLDRPISHDKVKAWLGAKGDNGRRLYPHIDLSIYQPVALHYTAAPVWIDRPDPLARRVMIWHGESDVVAVPEINIVSPARRAELGEGIAGPLDIAIEGETLPAAKRKALIQALAEAAPATERHWFWFAVGGGILRKGVPENEARAIVYQAGLAAGDEEADSRAASVSDTADALRLGQPATGWTKAAELAGDGEALDRARKACAPRRTTTPLLPHAAPDFPADGLVSLEEGKERIAGAVGEWWRAAADYNGWSGSQEPSAGLRLDAATPAPVHAVNVTMGGGKTHVAIEQARQLPPAETLYHAVSDHALSHDLEDRYRAAGIPARTVKGLGQTADDGRPMCRHFEKIMRPWIEAGQRAYDLCQRCPDRDECPTQEQRDDKDNPGVVIGPYNYLTLSEDSRPFATPSAVIVDENPMASLARGADKPALIALNRLANPPTDFNAGARPGKGRPKRLAGADQSADVRETCVMAHRALVGGALTTGALRAAGLDASRCSQARVAWYGRKAEIEPPGVDEFTADGVAETIKAGLANGDRDALRMARLFRMLETYLADDRDDGAALNGLEIVTLADDDGIERPHVALYWREEIKVGCPILLLDGTLNELIARKLFPALTAITNVRIEAPHCRVVQVVEGGLSMRRLGAADGLSDKDAKGGANKRGKVMDLAEVAAANALPDANGTRAVVATYKRTRADIERERKDSIDADESDTINGQWSRLAGGIDLAHAGHMRGVDRWGATAAIIIAGRPLPRPDALERLTRALFWDDPEPIETLAAGERQPTRMAGIRKRDSTGRAVEIPTHPDPRCAAVLDQICRAEVEQIAHRLRLVRRTADNTATVYLLEQIPIILVHSLQL